MTSSMHHGQPLPAYAPQLDRDGSLLPTPAADLGRRHRLRVQPGRDASAERRLAERALFHRTCLHGAIQRHARHDDRHSRSRITASSSIRCRSMAARTTATPHGRMPAAWPWATSITASSALFALARQYVLADHFFQGAFGGSFLNHQYLICACAPEYPQRRHGARQAHRLPLLEPSRRRLPAAPERGARIARVGSRWAAEVRQERQSSHRANYFGDGKFYAINTMQPPYQPSGNAPAPAKRTA